MLVQQKHVRLGCSNVFWLLSPWQTTTQRRALTALTTSYTLIFLTQCHQYDRTEDYSCVLFWQIMLTLVSVIHLGLNFWSISGMEVGIKQSKNKSGRNSESVTEEAVWQSGHLFLCLQRNQRECVPLGPGAPRWLSSAWLCCADERGQQRWQYTSFLHPPIHQHTSLP